MKASDLKKEQPAIIVELENHLFKTRLLELGFIPGEVMVLKHFAILKNPLVFEINGNKLSLRKSEAKLITVSPTSTRKDL